MSDASSTAAKYGYALAGFGAVVGVGFLVHLLTLGDAPARSNPAPQRKSPESGYWIKDPSMRPDAVAKRLSAAIKRKLGKGANVEIVKAEASMPRDWDYSNFIVLRVNGEDVEFALRVAVGQEASGWSRVGATGVMPVPRDPDAKQVEAWLTSEIVAAVGG